MRSKPSSQLNVRMFGNIVLLPRADPFIGTSRRPQSMANSNKIKLTMPFNIYVIAHRMTYTPLS
jgi:hypothetical protein